MEKTYTTRKVVSDKIVLLGLSTVVLMAAPFVTARAPSQNFESTKNASRLWYSRPAEKWTEAMPIGNGRLGAMVFGGGRAQRPRFSFAFRSSFARLFAHLFSRVALLCSLLAPMPAPVRLALPV